MIIVEKTRRPTAFVVAVAMVAGALTLAGAIGLGLRLPGGWLGSAPDDTAELDYAALGRRMQRLRDGYVQEVLATSPVSAASSEIAATSDAPPAPITHRFTNDDFEHAYAAQALPFSARSEASGATRQGGEPIDCVPAGGTSWYRYDASGPVALFANTFGTSGVAGLGVYTGDRIDQLTKVGCDLNALGNAQVGFRGDARTYWFQVTKPIDGGSVVFELLAVGQTTLETISFAGERADGITVEHPDISADGRLVAFFSRARNLTAEPPDCNEAPSCETLYLRDRATGKVTAIASSASPYQGDNPASSILHPVISPDGRYVGFTGYPGVGDTPLGYTGDADGGEAASGNVYVHDRRTGRTELVSRNSAGEPGRRDPVVNAGPLYGSLAPSFSADGRYVEFYSDAANLGGPREQGKTLNMYRRDRVTGETRLVSVDDRGEPMRANSYACTGRNISVDGRRIAFLSDFEHGGGTSPLNRAYVWDEATGRTTLITRLLPGRAPATAGNYCIVISANGSHVGFVSRDALVPEDTNGTPDVYVYEVATDNIRRVSVTSAGEQTVDPNVAGEDAGVFARSVTLSADGRYAAFDSAAPGLAPGAEEGRRQVFVHDLVTGATVLASVSSTGEPLEGESTIPYISADGRSVAFLNAVAGRVDVMVHELR